MISFFEKFSCVYCSGSFIKSQSALTALASLFEELYIPNNLELALEFAKHYKFTNLSEKIRKDSENIIELNQKLNKEKKGLVSQNHISSCKWSKTFHRQPSINS